MPSVDPGSQIDPRSTDGCLLTGAYNVEGKMPLLIPVQTQPLNAEVEFPTVL